MTQKPLKDRFGRQVTYLRLSVTDRCDLRCRYCMAENMQFLPKADILSFEEMHALARGFMARGVTHIRISGGEPLVRKDIMRLFEALGGDLKADRLREITLTSNGTQLPKYANALVRHGVRRVNISLDSLTRETFHKITRRDALPQVLAGIHAAQAAGLKVKLNTVALNHLNAHELPDLVVFAHARNMDISFIETMPMGFIDDDRRDQFLPLHEVRDTILRDFDLQESDHQTPGPARYFFAPKTGGRVGFISPLTHNFCANCNRVRVTCTGEIYTCLGQDGKMDLRPALRSGDPKTLDAALDAALASKPRGHDFVIDELPRAPSTQRHMSVTGG